MIYTTWEYYQNIFKGIQITDEDTFNRLAFRASSHLDSITRMRAKVFFENTHDNTPLQNACCAIVEILQEQETLSRAQQIVGEEAEVIGGVLISESLDGYARQWASPLDPTSEAGQKAFSTKIYTAAITYLAWTGLLYSGVILI